MNKNRLGFWMSVAAVAALLPGCSSDEGAESGGAAGSGPLDGTCLPGQQVCNGVCTDVSSDTNNCGACALVCDPGTSCVSGVCSCPSGLSSCNGVCVDLMNDVTNCGACLTACTGGEVCNLGACVCLPGLAPCGGTCVDILSDGNNCGGCGVVCTGGQVCSAGTCTSNCAPGLTQCGTSCVDTATNPIHCGQCNNVCPAGLACSGGICGCAVGQTLCNGACVNTLSDPLNCGACGTICAAGDSCINGTCQAGGVGGGTGAGGAGVGGSGVGGSGTGGSGIGGAGVGGSETGGDGAGGAGTGGDGTGGDAVGGAGTGGDGTGGTGTGGDGTGGDGTGGIGTGGDGTGGTGTGGDGTGGATCEVSADGHYQMEDLDRGVVAVRGSNGNYVGWRMMGYEYRRDDPSSVSYNLYRDGTLVANVTDSTNYFDAGAGSNAAYSVSAVIDGAECEQSAATTPWSENYIRIPLSSPGDYEANDATPGDLDGDGQYEIVLKWQPYNAKDNSQDGVTDNTYLEALELDGTSLWRIDLGRNIRSGAHYTQMSVYDFDGDGRAELAVKTAPGTRDGTGAYLSMGPAANDDDGADYRNSDGYILTGPEYLTVFDGQTGAELATVEYPVPRGNVGSWGDTYGNRLDRYNSGVAMVTDSGSSATGRPSIIRQRGYYTRMTISALNWRDGQLSTVWIFDSNDSGNGAAAGQGDHSAMAADMDGDLAQEINTGATTIGSDGTLRCTTGRGHGDAQHVGELVIGEGITVFTVYEGSGGYSVHRGSNCEYFVNVSGGDDNGRGVAEDIYPGNPGAEFWSATSSNLMSCANGSNVGSEPSSQNFLIYWDADETRELQDGASISKYGGGTLLSASGCSGNNGTKNTPSLTADLLGDWREELVVRESNNSALRVYTTTDVTSRRIYTLMHDPTYRMQVTFEQSSYNQPPHTGFHIGDGMADPPEPDIHVR